MIRIIDFRLIIEKHTTHEKYYPRVVSFSVVDSLPLQNAPSATIRVISTSNLNDAATVSQVEFDDIVRLQTSIRYSNLDKHVWIDIFEGRVQNQSKSFGSSTDIEFDCEGHIIAAFYAMITTDAAYTSQDASAILQSVTSTYLDRISYSASYVASGLLTVAAYNVESAQNFVIDTYKEMEKLSGYKKIIDVVPVYSASGTLQTCYLRWRALPTVPTKKYKVLEGSPRLISASFDIVGEDVINDRHVKGATYTDVNNAQQQYSGSAQNAASISSHDTRSAIDIFSWIQSNQLCADVAAGLVSDSAEPYIAGSVVLEGTPDAHVGDLVIVEMPSLEVNGSEIDGNYTVYRVSHHFSGSSFTTTLDLGRIKKDEYDYISKNITQVLKITYKNQCKR